MCKPVNKVVVVLARIDYNFERNSAVSKILSNIVCYIEIFHERKCQSVWQISYFKRLPIGQAQWIMPVISALQETEVGGSFEPRSLSPV